MPGLNSPALPEHAALLLDLDGTLLDFAPTPDTVVVPAGLIDDLHRAKAACGGALAVVTGRPIADIDGLLGDVPAVVAGEHGGAVRHHNLAPIERPTVADPPAEWLVAAERLETAWPGTLLERKRKGFVLHYRRAPHAGPALHTALRDLIGDATGFALMHSNMACEIRPVGIDKGTAAMAIMARPPFAGRVPVFIGDDLTDEDGMRAARALGGLGWRVQEIFRDPAGVRAWLSRSVA